MGHNQIHSMMEEKLNITGGPFREYCAKITAKVFPYIASLTSPHILKKIKSHLIIDFFSGKGLWVFFPVSWSLSCLLAGASLDIAFYEPLVCRQWVGGQCYPGSKATHPSALHIGANTPLNQATTYYCNKSLRFAFMVFLIMSIHLPGLMSNSS